MDIGDIRAALENVRTRGDLEAVFAVAAELAGGAAPAWAVAQSVWRQDDDANEPDIMRVTTWAETFGEPPPCVIDKVIPPNSVIGLCGKPKSGKTFMALELAEAVTLGGHAMGQWRVMRRGPVCYFSMEDTQYQFRDRLRMRGTLERDPDFYIYKGRKDVSTPDGAVWLEQKVADINPVLIVLDTARQAFGMANWNDAAEVTTRLRPLMDLAGRLPNGGSILLVIHMNKNPTAEGGDRISGSNALQSAIDGYIMLDKVRRNSDGDLEGEADCQGRAEMPAKFGWVMNHADLRFAVQDDADRERKARSRDMKQAGDRVVDAIRDLGGEATTVDIGRKLGLSGRRASELVSASARSGRICEAGKIQTDDRHTAKVWSVSLGSLDDGGNPPIPPYSPPPSCMHGDAVDDMTEIEV